MRTSKIFSFLCAFTVVSIVGAFANSIAQMPQNAVRKKIGRPKQEARLRTALALDRIIQPRFLLDMGVFGEYRVQISGHHPVTDDTGTKNSPSYIEKLLAISHPARRACTVGFLHFSKKIGKLMLARHPEQEHDFLKINPPEKPNYEPLFLLQKRISGDFDGGNSAIDVWREKNEANILAACLKSLPKLRQGQNAAVNAGKMLVVMRPVKASKASCLGCHQGAKPGETLGVMVYTIGRKGKLLPQNET